MGTFLRKHTHVLRPQLSFVVAAEWAYVGPEADSLVALHSGPVISRAGNCASEPSEEPMVRRSRGSMPTLSTLLWTTLLCIPFADAQSLGCPAGSRPKSEESILPKQLNWLDARLAALRGNLGIRNFTQTSDAAISPDGTAVYIAEVISACQTSDNCPCTREELNAIYLEESCPYQADAGQDCGFPGFISLCSRNDISDTDLAYRGNRHFRSGLFGQRMLL
eukprot:3376966-Rhodomonas_salina.2